MTVLADTGFVLALSISTDKWHQVCRTQYYRERLISLPESSRAEIAYMLNKAGGIRGMTHFLAGLSASRFQLVSVEPEDLKRTAELLQRYENVRLDFVDATIIALAERMGITRILTVDRRDFQIVRPRHIAAFELLP